MLHLLLILQIPIELPVKLNIFRTGGICLLKRKMLLQKKGADVLLAIHYIID